MDSTALVSTPARRRRPLYQRVLVGLVVGIALGSLFGARPVLFGLGTPALGALGLLAIRALKTLATPLILFAVLDGVVTAQIPRRKGLLLLAVSAVNAAVAVLIGLGVAGALGASNTGLAHLLAQAGSRPPVGAESSAPTLDPWSTFAALIPENLIDPFRENRVIGVVLLALLFGIGLRAVREHGSEREQAGAAALITGIHTLLALYQRLLGWIVELLPFAVACVVAAVVGKTGVAALAGLGPFVGTILLGLLVHGVVYYALLLRLVAGQSPLRFFRAGADAVLTALSAGSSLATLPVTLRCLERMKVSTSSARLAACVGTNLNHDGIILYEAAATLLVARAIGMHLPLAAELGVALAAIMAGIGIAGVPEAGLLTLPLVLSAGGIPPATVVLVIPLILPIDPIIGRFRAATSVVSDMIVAVLLDRFAPPTPSEEDAGSKGG